MKTLLASILSLAILFGCSSSIKTTDAAKTRLTKHRTVAVLPFEVRFDLRIKNDKQFTEEDLGKVKQFMSLGLQEHLYHWLKDYNRKKPFTVAIQDLETTNTILSENKIRFVDVYTMSRVELTKLLKVDAVLTPQVIFSQPHSEGESITWMVMSGAMFGPGFIHGLATQEMKMQVLVNDDLSEETLWTFVTKTQSSGVTKPSKDKQKENILYPLFRNIDETLVKFIKQFPYRRSNF